MVRKKQTVADFPPEFMDAWSLALKGELSLDMGTVGAARNMIQRLYTFRKRLIEEAPELGASYYLVDLRVHDEFGNVIQGKPTRVLAKAIIRAATLGWKDQIRKQSSVLEGAEELKTATPVGVPSVVPISNMNERVTLAPDTGDNLSEALSNAGYSTGEG